MTDLKYTMTDRMRDAIANSDWMDVGRVDPETIALGYEYFDRWLNEERAKAWDLARSEVRSIPSWYNTETGKGGFDLQPLGPYTSSEEGAWDAVMEILDQNPYRKADS